MSAFGSPHEIARETLRRMAARREPPTPVNYRKTYTEVCGKAEDDDASADPGWTVLLRTLTQQLDLEHQGSTAAQKKQALLKLLETATDDSPPAKTYEALSRLSRQWSRLPPSATITSIASSEGMDCRVRAIVSASFRVGMITEIFGCRRLNRSEAPASDCRFGVIVCIGPARLISWPSM